MLNTKIILSTFRNKIPNIIQNIDKTIIHGVAADSGYCWIIFPTGVQFQIS